jgi:Carbohydrate family 9 binding domain-like
VHYSRVRKEKVIKNMRFGFKLFSIVVLLFLFCEKTICAGEVNFLKNGSMKTSQTWKFHKAKLLGGGSAAIDFSKNGYGTCKQQIQVQPNWPKKLIVSITYKFKYKSKARKDKRPAGMNIRQLDSNNKIIKNTSIWTGFHVNRTNWTTAQGSVKLNPEGKMIVVNITSFNPAILEVKECKLYAQGIDISHAAAMGIKLPKMDVAAGKPVSRNSVEVKYFNLVPFDINAALWGKLHKYTLKPTDENKTLITAKDLEASFKIACDMNAIYILMTAIDDKLKFNSIVANNSVHNSDSFEFYINPTGLIDKKRIYQKKDMQIQLTYDPANGKTKLGGFRLAGRNLGLKAVSHVKGNTFTCLLRVPFKTDGWDMAPFDGLTFTGNVMYNDADLKSRENIFTFSDDPQGESWRDKSKFTKFTISSNEPLPYAAIKLPYIKKYALGVPRYAGIFNLEAGDCFKGIDNYSIWGNQEGITYEVNSHEKFNNKSTLCIDGTKLNPHLLKRTQFLGSPFNVIPGETLNFSFYAKLAKDSNKKTRIRAILLTRCNWKEHVVKISPGKLTTKWRKYTSKIKIPEHFGGIDRQVRLFLRLGPINGNKVFIAERKIVRMNSGNIDLRLHTPGIFAHFNYGKPQKLLIDIANSDTKIRAVKIKCIITDYLTGKQFTANKWDVELNKNETKSLSWEFDTNRKGFFNADLRLCNSQGDVIMQRYLAFSVGISLNGLSSDFFGIWTGDYRLPVVDSTGRFCQFIRNCGVDKFFMAKAGKQIAPGKMSFYFSDMTINAFYNAGFEISSKVNQASYGSTQAVDVDQDSDIIYKKCFQAAAHYKGKIKDFCYANEPNLGWGGAHPDGREWANAYRSVFNGFKNGDPAVNVYIGDMADVPVEFLKDYSSINGRYFSSKMIGVHPYTYNYDVDAFEKLLEEREALYKLYPGYEVRDQESGLVHKTYPQLMSLHSRKEPTLRSAGISRHYLYPMIDMFCPYSDSTPLLPIRTFQTLMYDKTSPLGKMVITKDIFAFLFKKKEGNTEFAVIWNKSSKPAKVSLPVLAGAEVYDMFGNQLLKTNENTKIELELNDNYIRYINGINLAALLGKYKLTKAFNKIKTTCPETNIVTNPYLIIEPFNGLFTRNIPLKQQTQIPVILRNDSDKVFTVKVSLDYERNQNFACTSTPAELTIKPHSKNQLTINCSALDKLSKFKLRVSGIIDEGKELVPLVFTINTTSEVSVEGYSRVAIIRNNTNKIKDKILMFKLRRHTFEPNTKKLHLMPESQITLPFKLNIGRGKTAGIKYISNYQMTFAAEPDKRYNGYCYKMESDIERKYTPFDFKQRVRYEIKPKTLSSENFNLKVMVRKGTGYLRILAKVHDSSPIQTGATGVLRSAGDCLVIGIDQAEPVYVGPTSSTHYGKGDFEVGFALSNGKAEGYYWNGRYGLESAKPAANMIKSIKRIGNDIYYDLIIPVNFKNLKKKELGFSILAINRTKSGKNETCTFGEGLEGESGERNLAKFGILNW